MILGAAGHSQAGHHNLVGDHIQVAHRSQAVGDSRRQAAELHMQAAGSQEVEPHSQAAAHTEHSAPRSEDPQVVGLRQAVRPLEAGHKHGHVKHNLVADTQPVVDRRTQLEEDTMKVEDGLN